MIYLNILKSVLVNVFEYTKKPFSRKNKITLVSRVVAVDGYAMLEDHFIGVLDNLVGKRCRITVEVIEEREGT